MECEWRTEKIYDSQSVMKLIEIHAFKNEQ